MTSLLSMQAVTKSYGNVPVLDSFDLEIGSGKIIGLLGPNGSGKTTIIKLIAGLLTPNSGKILIDERPVGIETKNVVSYLPERTYFSDWMKVNDILSLFNDFYRDFDSKKAVEMLKLLNISQTDRLKSMSKGTKEKVQLVLVMSRKAKLYLLDEPIGGVDPAARDYILNTIISNYCEDSSVMISTHLITDIERILDEFIFLKNGKIDLFSDVDSIREEQGKSIDALFREVYKC